MKAASSLALVASLSLMWTPWLPAQTPAGTSASAPPITDFKKRLALLAADEASSFGAGSLEYLERDLKRKLTADETRVFTRTDEGSWKEYQDEWIRFELPDDALLTVEVVDRSANKPIKVVGGVATMADNSFERAYWLKVGDVHYGVILVREADWLDEGICFCGPVAYKKCVLADGTLLEFSLLPSGKVKKVQALGEKHRAMLFEWTHSVIPQSTYARIGSSVRLKTPGKKSLQEWQAYSREKRGWEGLIPWLEGGDSAEKVLALLGKPSEETPAKWTYAQETWNPDGSGSKSTATINITAGKFAGVDGNWQQWEELPPKHATVAWALARLRALGEENVPEADKAAAKTTDMPVMLEMVLKNAPGSSADDWSTWMGIARDMANLGWKDPRIGALVLKRYAEKDLPHFYCMDLLEAYDVKDRQKMMADRLGYVLEREEEHGGEINNLFANLDPKTSEFAVHMKRALSHEDARTRFTAYNFADRLPRAAGLEALKKGLDDPDTDARGMAALNIDEVVTRADVAWLQERLAAESNQKVKKGLQQAIDTARERK